MARFKRESWVKKMQDDFSDAYPTRPVYKDTFETTSRDYANWSDPVTVDQKTREAEGGVSGEYRDAAEYKQRSEGHVASARKVHFTPYVSSGGYSHDYSYNYRPLDNTQTRYATQPTQNYFYNPPVPPTNKQQLLTGPTSSYNPQGGLPTTNQQLIATSNYNPQGIPTNQQLQATRSSYNDHVLNPYEEDISSILPSGKALPPLAYHSSANKLSQNSVAPPGMHMYSRLLTKSQSGPALTYKRRMLLKANPHLTKEDFEKAGLLPPPSKSAMQELLDVTYKEPWKHFHVLK